MASTGLPDRVAVTGAGGFVGSRLCEHLMAEGHEIVALSAGREPVGSTGLIAMPTPSTVGDITAALRDVGTVIHLAARSGGIGFQNSSHSAVWETNSVLTNRILSAAVDAGCRRVFLASSAVVYAKSRNPLRESDRVVSLNDRPTGYAWSKLTDEALGGWVAAATGIEVVVGRFTNIYGPTRRSKGTVIEDLVARAQSVPADEPLVVWGDGSAVRSFIHVDDAVHAITTIAARGVGTYNVDSGKGIRIGDLAELIRRRFAPQSDIRFDTSQPVGTGYRVLDPTRLMNAGWAPTKDLASTIAEYP